MRTLLIDNHDSYTYNLFQLIAEVNGVEPVVVVNDAARSADLTLDRFDNVVISPGPGHPGRPRNFGVSARLLAQDQVPVLGVCLGHQGLGLAETAEVGPAPVPRHGHVSAVRHNGKDLFAGLPQGFAAVRYHSLCVLEPLPEELEATAWAEDGVLMGVRHRHRPQWGVQFHPESVLTQHGAELLANFRELTERHGRQAGRRPTRRPGTRPRTASASPGQETAPSGAEIPAAAPSPTYVLRTRVHDRAVDPEAVFTGLFAASTRAFWLDSSRSEPGLARFSFLGDDTGPLAEFLRYDVDKRVLEIERAAGTSRVRESVLDYLRRELGRRRIDAPNLPFDFTGGYVGYFGYELKADCGSPNRHRAATPDACWLFADRLVVVDHQERVTYAICVTEDSEHAVAEASSWLDATLAFLDGLPTPAGPDAAHRATPRIVVEGLTAPWLVRDREQYLADIEACQEQLRAGESYEICLTNAAYLPAFGDSSDYYRILRRVNPAPYSAYLRFGELDVASSSPERFLRITRDRVVEAKPIKGTAPRGQDPKQDARLRAELASSAKTRAENLMIADLLRNDLGRVCEVGTVTVPRLMSTETYSTVHQLVSTIRGRLRADADAVDAVRACFPGGSMTGAPKERTCEIIDGLETEARGVYSGALGYLSCNGTADLSIVIRTAVFTEGRMRLGAGGAIVLDSDPDEEYEEMLLKLAAPMRAYLMWLTPKTAPAHRRWTSLVDRSGPVGMPAGQAGGAR